MRLLNRHSIVRNYLDLLNKKRKISNFKPNLTQKHPTDIEGDLEGQDSFIKKIDCQAI